MFESAEIYAQLAVKIENPLVIKQTCKVLCKVSRFLNKKKYALKHKSFNFLYKKHDTARKKSFVRWEG